MKTPPVHYCDDCDCSPCACQQVQDERLSEIWKEAPIMARMKMLNYMGVLQQKRPNGAR